VTSRWPGTDRKGISTAPDRSGFRMIAVNRAGAPRCVVLDGKASQSCRWECIAGCGIIGESRGNSAHLHRPWRANPTFTKLHSPSPVIATMLKKPDMTGLLAL
jgi:hypothetical protein